MKEKKQRELPEWVILLKKIWENPRYKALIKLCLYFVFIFLVISVYTSSNNIINNEEIIDNKFNYTNMEIKLSRDNYNFQYEILDREIKYIGKSSNDKIIGEKIEFDKITKFYYDDQYYIYKDNTDEGIIDNNIFSEFIYNLYNVNTIFDYLKDVEVEYTTTYKDSSILKGYKIDISKVLNIDNLLDKYITIETIEKPDIYEISLDLLELINYNNEEPVDSYKLKLIYSEIGTTEEIEI